MRVFAQADGLTRLELDRAFRLAPRLEVTWRMFGESGSPQVVKNFRVAGQNVLIRPIDTVDWDSPVTITVTQRPRFLGRVVVSKIVASILSPRPFDGGLLWGECVNPTSKISRLTLRWRWNTPPALGDEHKVMLLSLRDASGVVLAEAPVASGQDSATLRLRVSRPAATSQTIYVQFLERSSTGQDSSLAEAELEIPGRIS